MRFLAILLVAVVAGCADSSETPTSDSATAVEAVAQADDPEALGGEMPAYAARLLSNPYVEASYFALPPGQSVALQNGQNWVVYAYSDAALSLDGAASPTSLAAGSATFYDEPVRLTNTGDEDAELIFFERWDNPLPDRREGPDPDVRFPTEMMRIDELDSPAVNVLESNDQVGVARVSLAPGEGLPPHSAFSRVVVALSEFDSQRSRGEEFGGDSPDVRVHRDAGSVTWDTARNYAVENVGDTPSETLVVAYYQ